MMPDTDRCRVVTIAFTDGARAEEIGRRVATDLGFRYVDDQIVERAAEMAGVTAAEVAAVEHSQPLIGRILAALAMSAAMDPSGAGVVALAEADPSPAYRALIREVILQTAGEGDVVIVAHGAGVLLAGMPGVVRVFVTASSEVRTARIAGEQHCSAKEAARIVEKTDRERAAYLQRFYGVSREQPTQYDLVLNTDRLAADDAARIIAFAAGVPAIVCA